MNDVVIVGIGGMALEMLDLIDACNQAEHIYRPLGFVVDPQYGTPGDVIQDLPILGGFDWLEQNASVVSVVCAIGESHRRYRVVNRLLGMSCRFTSLVHPWTRQWLQHAVSYGDGVILNGNITSGRIRIGSYVYFNALAVVGHDCTLMDFTTLAPGVHIDGYVTIETGSSIGTGAVVLPKVRVGEWSTIGAGSVISKDVEPNTTVLSAHQRVTSRREAGWHLLPD